MYVLATLNFYLNQFLKQPLGLTISSSVHWTREKTEVLRSLLIFESSLASKSTRME